LLPLLRDPHPDPRQAARMAIGGRCWMENRTIEACINAHLSDCPDVRAGALGIFDFVGKDQYHENRGLLLGALADPTTVVRATAIDILADSFDRDALTAILALREDPDALIQSAIDKAIDQLSPGSHSD
jgi:hypothetical protein